MMKLAEELAQELVEVALAIVPAGKPQRGLSKQELHTLRELKKHGSLRVGFLREKIDVLGAQMSRILNKLEKNQLIRRTINEDDRRSLEISLTNEGIRRIETEIHEMVQKLVGSLSGVDAGDLRCSIATLQRIRIADVKGNGKE